MALTGLLRDFFNSQGLKEVLTPPLVENPGMEVHIRPFQVLGDKKLVGYLHTSPEFHMKEMLSLGFKNIYTIGYSFRNEPQSSIHRNQFLMLEWYRANHSYESIMKDCSHLITYLISSLTELGFKVAKDLDQSPQQITVEELFLKVINLPILSFLNKEDLYTKIKKDFSQIPLPKMDECEWDDLFFLLFLNLIEPQLKNYPIILLKEWPAPLSALSTLKQSDKRVCERFEIYIHGIEIANCFNELIDLNEQKKRFNEQKILKEKLYGDVYPDPSILYKALERGLPPSSGIALGVERLLSALIPSIENPFWE